MAVTADRVIVELEAKLGRYEANLRRAEQRFDAATRSISGDAKKMERDISRNADAVGAKFRALAGAAAAAFSVAEVAKLADGYTRFTNQLKVAGQEGEGLAQTQEKLFLTAQKYGVELESLGTLYSRGAQVSKELGASQAELLQFTNGVAAALKVQGGSAASAQGALLQLSQALGSGTVRAEEFNSINEGALPILKAVAQNLDGAGGSVARLKVLVNDGKVSSDQFFRAFLAGSAELEAQAEKTSLTIAASFTVLNNALGKFIGEGDQALSATEQISAAIIKLSENLDTVANAVAVLGAVLLGRFAAGMVAGAASTGVASTALFAFQARAIGAATTVEALGFASATAGRAMLAAFGGPVGLAVTALTLGLGYLALNAESAADETANLEKSAADAAATADEYEQRLRDAGVAMYEVDSASAVAADGIAGVGKSAKAAESDLYDLEQQAIRTATAMIDARLQENTRKSVELGTGTRRRRRDGRAGATLDPQYEAERAALDAEFKELNRVRNAIITGVRNGVDVTSAPPGPGASVSASGGRKKTGSKGGSGPSVDEIARQFEADVAAAELEIKEAQAAALDTVAARREIERERIRYEQEQNKRAIEADQYLSAAQKERLSALEDEIAAARLGAIAAQEAAEAAQDAAELQQADLQNQQAILQAQSRLAETAKERRAIELRLLDLQYEEERIRLEAIAANKQLTDAEREAARRRLAQLDQERDLAAEDVSRRNQSPLEAYRDRMDKSRAEIEEDAERWVVEELEGIQSKLADGIKSKLGVKDPILGGFIDLFIQQAIIKPITDSFSEAAAGGIGGGGFGGLFASALGSIFGRASGGHVVGGKAYRVNETGVEGFVPAGSGKIIPLGRMKGAQSAGPQFYQTVQVDASNSVNPEGYAEHIVSRVRKETVAIVGEGMQRVSKGVPTRLAQYQRDGI